MCVCLLCWPFTREQMKENHSQGYLTIKWLLSAIRHGVFADRYLIMYVFCRLSSSTPCLRKSLSLCLKGRYILYIYMFYYYFLLSLICFSSRSTADGGLSIPRMIINQLKWLDRVVDTKVIFVLYLSHSLRLFKVFADLVMFYIYLCVSASSCRNCQRSWWSLSQ